MPQPPQSLHRKDAFLALIEAQLRDTRDISLVGLLKWVLDPLAYMAMYFMLIGLMLQRQEFAYPLFILCAVVPWRYVQGVTLSSMVVMDTYSQVLETRRLPSGVLPLVVVATEGASFVIGLVLLAPLMAFYRLGVTGALLWLPVVVGVLALLVTGPAYLGALFGLYFPDYRSTFMNLTRIGFLASTALVPLKRLPGDNLPRLIQANPMSGMFDSFRDIFIRGQAPTAAHLAYPFFFGLVLTTVAVALYRWREFEFAKEI